MVLLRIERVKLCCTDLERQIIQMSIIPTIVVDFPEKNRGSV